MRGSKVLWSSVVVLSLLVAAMVCTPVMAASLFEEDFESGNLDQWTTSGYFQVDETEDGGHALFFDTNTTSGTDAAEFRNKVNVPENYVMEARIMLPELNNQDWQPSYYFYLSYTSWEDYVRVGFYPYEQNGQGTVRVFRMNPGNVKETYGESVLTVEPGSWHNIKVEVLETDVTVYFDGTLVLNTVMPEPLPSGLFGMGNWIQKIKFDDIVLKDMEGFDIKANGKPVESLDTCAPGDVISVSAYLPGDIDTERAGSLILQLSNGQEPVLVTGSSAVGQAGALAEVKAELTLPDDIPSLDGYQLEIMLWDGYTTMNPLCEPLVLE